MCSDPKTTPDGKLFACRACDECIAARRSDWEMRGMAERAVSAQTLVVALTYSDDTEESRSGAAMFRYSDIQALVKRLRSAIKHKYGVTDALRYICAGEQGDRNGRCHWHIVFFSQIDLTTLGEIRAPWGVVNRRQDIVSQSGQPARRRSWSLWPFGLVTFQEADQGGIKYAISYALKDQFSPEKAKGQKREARSETWATGLFRVSKKPPIGFEFLRRIVDGCAQRKNVLPHLRIEIPDARGYWRPVGLLREYLLTVMREINEKHKLERGRNCAAWSALLQHVSNSENDLEVLTGGDEIENLEEALSRSQAVQRDNADRWHIYKTATRCGSSAPCSACLRSLSPERLSNLGISEAKNSLGVAYFRFVAGDETGKKLRRAQSDRRGGHNIDCQKSAETPEIKKAFPHSARSC